MWGSAFRKEEGHCNLDSTCFSSPSFARKCAEDRSSVPKLWRTHCAAHAQTQCTSTTCSQHDAVLGANINCLYYTCTCSCADLVDADAAAPLCCRVHRIRLCRPCWSQHQRQGHVPGLGAHGGRYAQEGVDSVGGELSKALAGGGRMRARRDVQA